MRVLFGILVLLATIYNPAHAESYTVLCPENYYIVDEHCEPCPTGYINPAGSNTECTKKCADGEYWGTSGPWWAPVEGCVACPDGYPYVDTDTEKCYSDTKMRPYDGTVTCRNIPTGCTSATCTVCESEPAPCEYIEYSDGTVKSGCTANPCLSDIVDSGYPDVGFPYNPETNRCENECPAGTKLVHNPIFLYTQCTPCAAGTYKQTPDANPCTTCPAGTYSDAGAAQCTPCAPGTYSDTTGATECTPCADGMTSVAGATQCVVPTCDNGFYGDGTTCTKCPDEYPYSDIGATEITKCYGDPKLREWTGEQTAPDTLPAGCAGATYDECKIDACEYVAYYHTCPFWDPECGDKYSTIKSGCETNNANCVKPILSVMANPGYVVDGVACTACPAGTYSPGGDVTECIQCPKNTYSVAGAYECTPCPDDYPNSDAGSTNIGACYSNEKERPWTGHQVCNTPTNCTGVVCSPCEIKPCKYVAYMQWWGGDGTIKSGCTTNNANCATPVRSATAAPGWRTVGTSRCEICPAGTYGPGGENAQCTTCPQNVHVSKAGATQIGECGRILKYKTPSATTPMEIFLSGIRNTAPSLNVKIGNDILYANMTEITDTSAPGMYIGYNGKTYKVSDSNIPGAGPFAITTTDGITEFGFSISAAGDFTVDWGDGTIEKIVRNDTTDATYSHTYTTAGQYTITLDGRATNYGTAAAITFNNKLSIAQISGFLGKVFPTIGDGGAGNQPLFTNTFNGATNLTGEIPAELFAGIGGTPAPQMFIGTFNGCSGLTGLSPRMADGTPLYTWAALVENACPETPANWWDPPYCNTFAGATGLSDYDEIPDAFK